MSRPAQGDRLLTVLNRFGRDLEADLTPRQLAQHLIEILEEELGYEYGAVLLVDRDTARLVPLALSAQGNDADFVEEDKLYVSGRGPRVGEGVTGWVARTGEPAHIADVTSDRRYTSMRDDIRSELCVPLFAANECVGVLNIESPRPDAYNEADYDVLRALAPHLATAIRSVDLQREADGSRVSIIELQEELRNARGTHRALLNELNHRVRNNLASVSGLVDLALIGQDNVKGLAEGIKRRVQAMAAVHALLSATTWGPVELSHLFNALSSRLRRSSFVAEGPDVALVPDRVTALGLVLTELIDESLAAGALAIIDGVVQVNWTVTEGAERRIEMTWLERGAIAPLARRSPQTVRLVEGVLCRELGGTVAWTDKVGAPDRFAVSATGAPDLR